VKRLVFVPFKDPSKDQGVEFDRRNWQSDHVGAFRNLHFFIKARKTGTPNEYVLLFVTAISAGCLLE